MAKEKYGSLKGQNFSDLNDFISQFDPEGEVLSDFEPVEINEWIHTGSYLFNAHISGSMLKGVPSGRIITIAGDPKTGKSYLAFNVIRHAIALGYTPFLIETEASPDKERFKSQKLDMTKIRITQPETVKGVINILSPLTNELMKAYKYNKTVKDQSKLKPIPKLMFIIDSASGLLPGSQLNSADEGNIKADMGSAVAEMGILMNILTTRCAKLNIPVIMTYHTTTERIQKINLVRKKPKGGMAPLFYSSIVVMLSKYFEKDDDKNKLGVIVNSGLFESRFSAYKDITFHIPFQKGINPYFGLQAYISWKACGIDKGKWVDHCDFAYEFTFKKIVNKDNIEKFKFNEAFIKANVSKPKFENYLMSIEKMMREGSIESCGNMEWRFTKKVLERFDDKGKYPKPTERVVQLNPNSPKYVVRHLPDETLTLQELLTKKVFTYELLQELDENIMRPTFELAGGAEEDSIEDLKIPDNEDFFNIEGEVTNA